MQSKSAGLSPPPDNRPSSSRTLGLQLLHRPGPPSQAPRARHSIHRSGDHGVLLFQRVSAWRAPLPSQIYLPSHPQGSRARALCAPQRCRFHTQPALCLTICVSPLVTSPLVSFRSSLFSPPLKSIVVPLPDILSIRRQGFGGRGSKGNQTKGTGQGTPSPTTPSYPPSGQPPSVPPMPHSPALSSAMSFERQDVEAPPTSTSRRPPFFFREEYSSLIVKGNFMTLAAKPKLVEEGEWLAHQGILPCITWINQC